MLPEDQMRVILMLVISIPLSLMLRCIHNQSLRKCFSIVTSLGIQYATYGPQLAIAILMHFLVYGLIVYKGRNSGLFITSTSMILLSAYHIYRLIVDYGSWTLDVSTILMGNVGKYSYFAYAYEDGGKTDQQLKTKEQRQQKLEKLPSFLDYLAYCNFLPACIVSTPISYYKYSKYIRQQDQFKSIPYKQTYLKMGKDLLKALGSAGVYFLGVIYLPTSWMSEPYFTEANSGFYVFAYSWISTFFIMFKYFLAFKLCMLPIHASGVSYNPALEDHFDGVECMNIRTFLGSISLPNKVSSWNMQVQEWLRKCIYQRLKMSKEKAKLATFMVSAFWHGFYGGYYFTFLLLFLNMYLSNLVFKLGKYTSHPLIVAYNKSKPISYYLLLILADLSLIHAATFFIVLSAKSCLKILSSIYFLPFIYLPLLIWLTQQELRKYSKRAKEVKEAKEQ